MMKIKNSATINEKPVFAAFAVAAVVALGIRIYQLICLIDNETGFYKYKNASVYILYAVIALVGVCVPVIMFFRNHNTADAFPNEANRPAGIASILCAAAFCIDFMQSMLTAAVLNAEKAGTGNITGVKAFMKTGALPTMVQGFIAIPCAVYFICLATGFLKGDTGKFQDRKILALMPIGWGVLRMIRRFVRQISFQNVSDLFIELIMIAFLLIFFMAFAQIASGVYNEGAKWRISGFGLPAVLLCVITSVPRLIFLVSGMSSRYINSYHPFYACDLALAIFIAVIVISGTKEQPLLPKTESDKPDESDEFDEENTDVS